MANADAIDGGSVAAHASRIPAANEDTTVAEVDHLGNARLDFVLEQSNTRHEGH